MPGLNLKLMLKKENILENKTLLIEIAIALIFLWYGYGKIYKPMIASLQKINKDIQKENLNAGIAKGLMALKTELTKYRVYFAKDKEIPWLVDKVSQAANESGIKVVSLNSKLLISLDKLFYSSVDLTVAGTFHQLGNFVSKIENSKEFIRIEKLFFKKDNELLKAEMVVSSYFWK